MSDEPFKLLKYKFIEGEHRFRQRDGYELYALYYQNDTTIKTIGKLKVASYPLLSKQVTIVPMQDIAVNKTNIEVALNNIYKPYGITWEVTIDQPFTNTSWDTDKKGLETTGSGFFSEYTPEMKALNAAYTRERGVDNQSVYLFWFAQKPESDQNLQGDMPLESRFGYLFSPTVTDKTHQTMAHELGHGVFQLRHTFGDRYNIPQNTTTNLMDYAGGGVLKKYQWDLIHDPALMLFAFFQDESEGASMATATPIDSMYLYLGANRIQPNSYQLITATPVMPDIRIRPFKSNYTDSAEIDVRLKIEYKRWNADNTQVRNDSTFYPSSGWKKVKINEIWDIDFGAEMRGGKAYVYYKSGNTTKSEIFYIRGTNPTEQAVRTYLTAQSYNEWFIIKIIREESGSTVVGQAMKQFNSGTNYGTAWTSTIGCPNMGYPRGFGLMQLDNFGTANGTLLVANPNQIWNWKANIDRGVQFLRDDKIDWAERRINGYLTTIQNWNAANPDNPVNDSIKIERGDNAGSTVLTVPEGNTTINETIAINPTGTQRRIQDALTLKYYNGGSYCTLRLKQITNKPYWTIDRLNNLNPPFNYVERVCGRNP